MGNSLGRSLCRCDIAYSLCTEGREERALGGRDLEEGGAPEEGTLQEGALEEGTIIEICLQGSPETEPAPGLQFISLYPF
jgi:hypothetical protein